MKAAGKNQVALASAAGLDQGYVSKLLKGQANLTLKKIDAIAAALGFSGSDLLRHPGDPASALESGRADVPASARAQARILELTKELEDRNAQLRAIERAARHLLNLAVIAEEDRTTSGRTPRRSKGGRATG